MSVSNVGKIELNVDILVVFDPKNFNNTIVSEFDNRDSALNNNEDIDVKKIIGVLHPLIKINNRVISQENIISIQLRHTEFLPYISVVINDYNNIILKTEVPGMNNEITFIMTSPINGNYKKIKLNFYITSSNFSGHMFYCQGPLKFLPLEKVYFKAFPKSNTYDFLSNIAQETGLGFAATPKCKDIEDKHYRLILRKKYKDAILQQLSFSGVDINSIFDCWVDFFGYINMVNVSHLMTSKINPEEFKIKVIKGSETTNQNNTYEVEEVDRVLSNFDILSNTNLRISNYRSKINNAIVNQGGITKEVEIFNVEGSNDWALNNFTSELVNIEENSIDGKNREDYDYQGYRYLGVEMDEVPILIQTEYRNRYLGLIRSRYLEVTLSRPNIGLVRGMLVSVAIVDEDNQSKSIEVYNERNTNPNTATNEINTQPNINLKEHLIDDNGAILNKALSGIYYIDKEIIDYKNGKITLQLLLIKRGDISNYINKYTKLQFNSK